MLFETLAALVIAFALGSIPTAYIVGRLLSGRDIREAGSGNPGALNTTRQVGLAAGLFVLLFDAGKGIAAVVVAQALAVHEYAIYSTAFLATVGHNFSPVLKFRGGKGAATVLGISVYMLWQITGVSAAAGVLFFAVTRQAVWSVTVIFIVLNVLTIATGQALGQIVLCIVLSVMIAGTHLWRERAQLSESFKDREWRRFMSIE